MKCISGTNMKIDINESGLPMIFKSYQHHLLKYLWENVDTDNLIGSGKAHEFIQTTDDKKSRASVINFLNDMVDEGVLGWHDRTGKGGHHRLYYPLMNEKQFWKNVAHKVYAKVVEASGDTNIFK
jgi:hypothetical protein